MAGLDVSALTLYTNELTGLKKEVILQSSTVKGDIVTKIFGAIGDKHALNVIKQTNNIVDAACGGFTATGSTTLAQQSVQLCQLMIPKNVCIPTLKKYYTDWERNRSFIGDDSLGGGEFEDVFIASQLESMAEDYGKLIWQGSNSSPSYATTTGNNTKCDGFFQAAYEASASTAANLAKTAITVSNAGVVMDQVLAQVVANAPQMLDDFNVYVTPADFQDYLVWYTGQYKYNAVLKDTNGVESILHPGSIGMKIVKVNDMHGMASGSLIATPKDNIALVVSDEADFEFKSWFSDDFNEYRLLSLIKIGTGFYEPALVVIAK